LLREASLPLFCCLLVWMLWMLFLLWELLISRHERSHRRKTTMHALLMPGVG
jgi:hypothetical protein